VSNILIVTKENDFALRLKVEFSGSGFDCSVAGYGDKLIERVIREVPELILVDLKGPGGLTVMRDLTDGNRIPRKIPIIAIIPADYLNNPIDIAGADDFVISPHNEKELILRVKRLIRKTTREDEVLKCDDLVIDLSNCEVRVAGKVVELTFKEYELLKFLAKDRGRVFTRETLLNKVWGYDYFGGDRTVDVHVRRLRSKIEISGKTFIETVRNIGYRFKKDLSN
jgi:two-component system, OmpR family, alkaline phosphatase synthesis response regulator PhoP